MTQENLSSTPHILHKTVVDVFTLAWGDQIKECWMHVHFEKQEVTILGRRREARTMLRCRIQILLAHVSLMHTFRDFV